jgi:lysophospholipase L1-like esterase
MVTGFLVAATICTPAQAAPRPAPAPASSDQPKIMLYGDSLTHSFNADWTWRYRLWQSLTEAGQSFDFVGPRNDVVEYTLWKVGSQGYRNPDFDRDHAALSGMKFMDGPYQPGVLARTFRPEVIVACIGANDLVRGDSNIDHLRDHWLKQIAQARTVDRGVDFVLVPLPQVWLAGFADYNAMLGDVATQLNTSAERVIVAPLANLDQKTDTFDGAHASTSGQRKIAATVAQALSQLGIGDGQEATAADPPDDHTWAPQPAATVDGTTVTVSWPAVTYASSENVSARDRASGAVGTRQYVQGESMTFTGVAGRSYDLWLSPVKGYLPIGTTSNTIRIDIPAN